MKNLRYNPKKGYDEKHCRVCGKWKSLDEFAPQRRTCKKCDYKRIAKGSRAWRARLKVSDPSRLQLYYKINNEKTKEYRREYYKNYYKIHKKRLKEQFREKQASVQWAYQKSYYQRNKEKILEYCRKRYLRLKKERQQ